MMLLRPLGTLFLVVWATSSAMSQDIRPVGEDEIAAALMGCWDRETTFASMRLERKALLSEHQMCFNSDGEVSATSFGGSREWGIDGVGSGGTFRVAEGKLHLTGSGDGWFLGADELLCDVVVRPGTAMQFRNCVDGDGEALANTSSSRDGE